MKNQILTFMTKEDESKLSEWLVESFPRVCFFDDCTRLKDDFRFNNSLNDCNSSFIWILNRDLIPEKNAEFDINSKEWWRGLPLVQFLRSRVNEKEQFSSRDVLVDGRLAVTGEWHRSSLPYQFGRALLKGVAAMSEPVDAVDPVSKALINPKAPGFRVFPGAKSWLGEDNQRMLKNSNTKLYFLPAGTGS